jgi:hypothetical protein
MFKKLQLPIIPLVLGIILFVSCSKTEKANQFVDPTIEAAKKWYTSSIHKTDEPDWSNAKVVDKGRGQKDIIIPFPFTNRFEKRSRTIRRIIITEQQGKFEGNVLLIMAKPEFVKEHPFFDPATFTGLASRFDLNMHLLYGGYYENGVRKYDASYQSFQNKQEFKNRVRTEMECSYFQDTYIDKDGVFTVYGYRVCVEEQGSGGGGSVYDPWEGSGGGGGGTGGGGGGDGIEKQWYDKDPEPTPIPEKAQEIKCELQNSCLQDVFGQTILKTSLVSWLNQSINSMFGGESNFDIIFREKSNDQMQGKMGEYNPIDSHLGGSSDGALTGGEVIIDINIDLLPKASKEYISAVFLHEALHGIMTIQGVHFNDVKYPFTNQHELMAESYTKQITAALRLIYPNLSDTVVGDLSWAGLQDTLEWKSQLFKDRTAGSDGVSQRLKRIYDHQLGNAGTTTPCH